MMMFTLIFFLCRSIEGQCLFLHFIAIAQNIENGRCRTFELQTLMQLEGFIDKPWAAHCFSNFSEARVMSWAGGKSPSVCTPGT